MGLVSFLLVSFALVWVGMWYLDQHPHYLLTSNLPVYQDAKFHGAAHLAKTSYGPKALTQATNGQTTNLLETLADKLGLSLPTIQGVNNQDIFFEGWYYKFVGPYTDDVIVVVPGIFINHVNQSNSEAFVMVVMGTDTQYYRFPVESFKWYNTTGYSKWYNTTEQNAFMITIGDCTFTHNSVTLSLVPDYNDDAKQVVIGLIDIENNTPWPVRSLHPGSMGVLSWIPGLQSYHSVLSMFHRTSGYISIASQLYDLEGGTGYLEKSWGSGLPDNWIWAQSNHFQVIKYQANSEDAPEGEIWTQEDEFANKPGEGGLATMYADHVSNHQNPVSLFFTVTEVPLHFNNDFTGYILGFLHQNTTHVFSTYQFDYVEEFSVDEETIKMIVVDRPRTKRLVVSMTRPLRAKTKEECTKKPKKKQLKKDGDQPQGEEFPILYKKELSLEEQFKLQQENEAREKAKLKERAMPPSMLYGPQGGKMTKFIRENLLGGRINVIFSSLISPSAFASLTPAQRKEYKQLVVGQDILYAKEEYNGQGRPSALEVMGDTEKILENMTKNLEAQNISYLDLVQQPRVLSIIATLVIGFITYFISSVFSSPSKKNSTQVAKAYDNWTNQGVLEHIWGEHIHHGYYPSEAIEGGSNEFKRNKVVLIEKLLDLAQLSPETVTSDPNNKSFRILDVGCGIGGSSRFFSKLFNKVPQTHIIGVTLSQAQKTRADQLNKKSALYKNVKIEKQNILNGTFEDNSFDLIWLCESIEHISEKDQLFRELQRMLKPNGKIIITTWLRRSVKDQPLESQEQNTLTFLENEWSLAPFVDADEYVQLFKRNSLVLEKQQDWTKYVAPTWSHCISSGLRALPWFVWWGMDAFIKSLRDMRCASKLSQGYEQGFIQYGVFVVRK